MFQDEARFGRISDSRRCWCTKPLRPLLKAMLTHEYVYAFAAVSPVDGRLDCLGKRKFPLPQAVFEWHRICGERHRRFAVWRLALIGSASEFLVLYISPLHQMAYLNFPNTA